MPLKLSGIHLGVARLVLSVSPPLWRECGMALSRSGRISATKLTSETAENRGFSAEAIYSASSVVKEKSAYLSSGPAISTAFVR